MKIYVNNETKAVAKAIPDNLIIETEYGIYTESVNVENNGEVVLFKNNIYWASVDEWSVIEGIQESDIPDPFVPHMYKYEGGVFSTVIEGWTPEPIPEDYQESSNA